MLIKFYQGRQVRDTRKVISHGETRIRIKFEGKKGIPSNDIIYVSEDEYRSGLSTTVVDKQPQQN